MSAVHIDSGELALRVCHIDVHAVDRILLILTLGFQDQFLENIIVSGHHTVGQASQYGRQACGQLPTIF